MVLSRLLFVCVIIGITLSTGTHAVCPLHAKPDLTQNTSAQAREKCIQIFNRGKKAYAEEDWSKAEPLLKQGLQLAEVAAEKALQADFLNLIGLVYYRRGQLLESLEYFRRALSLYQNYASSDSRLLKTMRASAASVLNNMGNAADQVGQIAASLKYKQEAMDIRLAIGDKGKIADSTNALGIAYEHLHECDKALGFYGRALKLYEALQDQQGITDACNNLGNVYDRLGEYEKALSVYQRSYDAATALDDKIGRAKVLNNMATTYESLGDLDKALELLRDAQRLQNVFADIQELANTLNNIGNVFADKGFYDQAFDHLFHALELRKSIGNPQAIAETKINVGSLYEALGRLAEAQSLYEQAGKALVKSDAKSALVGCISNLANIAAKQGRYKDALNLKSQELTLMQNAASPLEMAYYQTNLGTLYTMRGQGDDYDKALIAYNQALPGMEAIQNQQALAMLLDDIGAVYQHKQDYDQAIRYHKRALELRRDIGNLQEVVLSLTNLGGAYHHLNQLDQAEACFQEASQAFEKMGDQVGDPSKYGVYQQTLSNFYAHYANLKLARKRDMEALLIVERGRARGVALQAAQNSAGIESRLNATDLARKRLLERELSHTHARQIQMRQSLPSGDPEEETARLKRLRTAQHDFDAAASAWQVWRDAFYAQHPEYRAISGQTSPDTDTLRALAHHHSDTLYLEWQTVDENSMLLFALSDEGLKSFRLMVRAADLEQQIDAWLGAIAAGRFGTPARQTEEVQRSAAIYRLIFSEVEASGLLKADRFKRLVLVADGVLLHIPFAALVMTNGKRLIEQYAISSAISLGSLTWPTETSPIDLSVLCIADPLGDGARVVNHSRGEFGRLEGAHEEGTAIKALIPATNLLTGAQAREAQIKHEMPNYTVLHFATHGVLEATHPLSSALILAPEPKDSDEDGILEVREIAGMRLSARLAVLSACETAGGQSSGGDGLIGLTWAFRAAGCPAVVATQWKINDAVTASQMRVFYRALKAGRSKDDALQIAIQSVMTSKTHNAPYYWAAFQLIGDTSPLKLRNAVTQKHY